MTSNPLNTPKDGPPVVSVCYAPLFTDRSRDVEPVAREACAEAGIPDATLRYWTNTSIFNDCPLLKKSRAAYICLPAGAMGPGGADAL